MVRFSISLLLSGFVGLSAAQAQSSVGFGPRVGGNLSSATFSTLDQAASPGVDYSYTRSPLVGYQVGVAASFGRGHWAFQPALVFTEKGLKQQALTTASSSGVDYREEDRVSCRVHYLELPLNVVYGFGADGAGVQLFAGPYVAVGVGGKSDYTTEASSNDPNQPFNYSESGSQAFAFGNTFAEPDPNSTAAVQADARARRFDAGINAGVGYRRGPLQVQLGYGLGLVNAQPDYPASYQQRNDTGYHRTAQLTATYYFSPAGK